MNTRHAQLILTIVREGSFTAAARALFITQPTLSQTVKQIESQLGEPIFLRGRSPVELTPAGQLYVQAAHRLIQVQAQLDDAIAALHGHVTGTLRIGLPIRRANELLPQVLPEFASAYPDVRIEALARSRDVLEQKLLDGELDFALLSGNGGCPQLEYHLIASDELVLLAGKKTHLAQHIPSGSTISLAECASEYFVMPSEQIPERRIYDELLRGFKPRIRFEGDDLCCAKRLCATCSLVMFSPYSSFLSDETAQHQLAHYRLSDLFLSPLYLAHAMPLSPCAQTLSTLLANRFRAMTVHRI